MILKESVFFCVFIIISFCSFRLCMSVCLDVFQLFLKAHVKHIYFITSRIYVSLPFHFSHQW